MTRDLKFRAWDGDRMQTVLTLGLSEGYVSTNKLHSDIEDFVIMQFTGISDRNGKELYFDDKVKVYIGKSEYTGINTISNLDDLVTLINIMEDSGATFEIVGNIHEEER